MKIHKIILKDYQQFKDLEIDLTYPAGHEKAGQPLDKVCIIGQSGTGKTTLLRLVKWFVTFNPIVTPDIRIDDPNSGMVRIDGSYKGSIGFRQIEFGKELPFEDWGNVADQHLRNTRPTLINLPTEVGLLPNETIQDIVSTNFFYENEVFDSWKYGLKSYLSRLNSGWYVDLTYQGFESITEKVLDRVKEYQVAEVLERDKVAAIALNPKSKMAEIEESRLKFAEWENHNPNPIEWISKITSPILNSLGVQVKTEIDEDSLKNLGSIRIRTISGQDVPQSSWSTGTKQIIETAIPLVHLSPKDCIILIDEPERSLYPDIQSKIIDFYTSLTTDCQFFYATHSPIIASSFDPWEIVELKFDSDNRYVIQETNFEGERHVDNYTVYPKYQRWDRILMNLFDLKQEGNGKVRQEEMLNAVMLKHEIEALVAAKKNKGKAFKEKVEQFELLSKKLDFYAEP